MEKCWREECDKHNKSENNNCKKYININELSMMDCLRANQAPSSVPFNEVLGGLHVKMIQYFCDENTCSDGNDNQYPECNINNCVHRDRIVDELMDIIKGAA